MSSPHPNQPPQVPAQGPPAPVTHGAAATAIAPSPWAGSGPRNLAPPPTIDGLFSKAWPEHALVGRPRLVALAAGVGALAALLLPDRNVGLAWSLVLLAAGASIVLNSRRRGWLTWCVMALGCGLAALPTLRAAEWLTPLSILVGGLLIVLAIVPVSSVSALMSAVAAWPLAALRGQFGGHQVMTIAEGQALRAEAAGQGRDGEAKPAAKPATKTSMYC